MVAQRSHATDVDTGYGCSAEIERNAIRLAVRQGCAQPFPRRDTGLSHQATYIMCTCPSTISIETSVDGVCPGRVYRDSFSVEKSPPSMSFSTTQSMSCLAYESAAELVFGRSRKPVACGFDLVIGAGQVFPEVNFTLPMISVEQATWSQVVAQYEEMATRILERAVALRVPGLVLEFELLPAMTETPEWGAEITRLLESHLHRAYEKHGLRCALRVTPTDIRDQGKPPLLRSSAHWETLSARSSCASKRGRISSPSNPSAEKNCMTRG